ncbi:C3 and PZP-like alpha-2-macroglobulin domain-containing protein 8 [Linepithema humile]|uniref:C3 and PZP-like alpha-2-macroglobulin domain-containing protein 8 n=1 Tax=Linepithema humile TaxID=83485 RepID=UPI0006235BB1|nr:PREDICTED: C3 and PZP-like alpha-2-macroglobulin domain-containing protein 8 isoform X1 [Linepithema humile]XP_012219449.1 PREDICTED: C3 and PZP-like alpha-2-macroglobulin domain-containing protein 8 isoform X1 [Linepithema humile]XP_012219450.1 PREDICTED: C3 and PZP-like alpha-2-macroglobulin domain-containing protein 8 isoform X1 [Linepithema humile]
MSPLRITTADSLDYRYIPITKNSISIGIKASHDARIALRTHLGSDSNVYEIIIGGWGNTMSAIKRNNTEPDVAEAETRDILKSDEMCDIFIQWSCDGLLSVNCEDVHDFDESFMSYKDRSPFVINYVGFSTAWGATGEWIIEECQFTSSAIRQQLVDTCHFWVDFSEAIGLPQNAVMASEDGLYVGRAHHEGTVTPGGIRENVCTLVWGGNVHEKRDFQVLCGKDVNWVKSWEGSVPLHALPAGETEDGYALFIGRVLLEGIYHIGKIQPNHQVCYIPLNGQEMPYLEYEALVIHDNYGVECIGR